MITPRTPRSRRLRMLLLPIVTAVAASCAPPVAGTAATASAARDAGCPAGAHHALCVRSVAQARSDTAARAISFALRQVGVPYNSTNRLGPNGYDCSGLVWRSYVAGGVDIGARTSGAIATPGGVRVVVPMHERRAGDVLWYTGHVAIALADGLMVEAAKPGTNVRVVRQAHRGFSRAIAINAG
jgi:cell wall-associated NlpC family hydrolase